MAMLSVGLSALDIEEYFQKIRKQFEEICISVGCINSPENVTVTGREDQILILQAILEANNIFARRLAVNVAYHSPFLESIAAEYVELLGELCSQDIPATPKMISSVTTECIHQELSKGLYWAKNLLSPVKFSEAVKHACVPSSILGAENNDGSPLPTLNHLLEVGPHSTLQGPIMDIIKALPKSNIVEYFSTLKRSVPATTSLFDMLGRLHCRGHPMSLSQINQQSSAPPRNCPGPLSDLPEYSFDHSRSYWRESRISQCYRFRGEPRNPFLGTRTPDWNPAEAKWRRIIKFAESPWVQDHKVILHNFAANSS